MKACSLPFKQNSKLEGITVFKKTVLSKNFWSINTQISPFNAVFLLCFY